MKKSKILQLFLVLFVLLLLGMGTLILQNQMEQVQNVKKEQIYYPETRDLYNGFGLKDNKTLSTKKLLEDAKQVVYTDRIFNINQTDTSQALYASDIAGALQKKTGKEIYILPVPERGVFEVGYDSEKEQYNSYIEKMENALSDNAEVLNPLPEMEQHKYEYLYFRTENNWTMRGAFYGAQTFFKAIGYEEENLDAYREYAFGNFDGDLVSSAAKKCETDLAESIKNIEKDIFYIYLNGSNPNCEEVTFENRKGKLQTMKRTMIQLNSSGGNAVIASEYKHSVVEGRGEENLLLITDTRGKMMISYLSELFHKVYVSNIYEDVDFVQNLEKIIDEYDIKYIIWAQDVAEMGKASYMRALNPLSEEGGKA